MQKTILDLRNISKNFGGVKALSDFSMSIESGEIHCLVGENGSGKSTLIKIASGALKADAGEIYINGALYKNLQVMDSIREGIEVIYQDLSLYPNLTIAENIAMNQLIEKNRKFINSKIINGIAKDAINELKINLDLEMIVEDLSMGDKQLVAISRALTSDLKLIIMDEPTVALTRNEIELLFKVILSLKEKGISTLFLSHKLSEVFQISEKVTIIRDGYKVGEFKTNELDNNKIIFYMTGKKIEKEIYHYDEEKNKDNVLLELKNFSKKGNFKNINFKLLAGEIIGITGLLGSGRTELALSIFGLNKPDAGEIFVEKKQVKVKSPEDAIKLGISFLPSDRTSEGLFVKKPVFLNLLINVVKESLSKMGLINFKKLKSNAAQKIKDLEIKTASLEALILSLSGGNQQKVALGKWITMNPKIFILDSPTVGVDIGAKYNIYSIIKKLAQEKKMGIIMISDEIPEVMENCNRILLMKKGEITDIVYPEKTTENEIFVKISSEDINGN